MATVTTFTAEKILELIEDLKLNFGGEFLDGLDVQVGDLGTELSELAGALDNLNSVLLPQLQEDLEGNQVLLDNLNENTLPDLQTELAFAEADLSVLNGKFPITAPDIAAGAVTANAILADAVTANKIVAGAITTLKLAAGAVTANEIAANAIIANKINAGAIIASHMGADSVTANAIAADAVTANKIYAGAVTAGKIAAGAVTAGTIAAGAVTAGTIAAGAIDAMTITGATIRTSGSFSVNRLTFDTTGIKGQLAGSSFNVLAIGPEGNISAQDIYATYLYLSQSGTALQTNGSASIGGNVFVNGVATNENATVGNDLRILGSNGLVKITSTERNKTNIRPANLNVDAIYALRPSRYEGKQSGKTGIGFIAERAEALGLSEFVVYGDEGQVESFSYSGYVVALQTAIIDLNNRLKKVEQG